MSDRRAFATVVVAGILVAGSALAGEAGGGTSAFDRLKALEGTWVRVTDGKVTDEVASTWHVTAGGSAVVETLFPGTDHEMVTVYHRDGDDLVLTHYCAAQNQPRMRAKRPGDASELHFTFDGGTNIQPKTTAHMHEMTMKLVDANRVSSQWQFHENGKPAHAQAIEVARK